eukprot:CAMPEP_0178918178 /NCGR_PEP_ID=MMETSP0786-20121207/13681_1 /TAXON_ID=186022 /ORGANISM="Thalassionema frauenfeldii, Strain CCMP 1798" /LENGTH=256 /DNA_ID=CAMNT_0020591857 /DNA_START=53 /DNA_END=823 /DNA_ORIENTATION=-
MKATSCVILLLSFARTWAFAPSLAKGCSSVTALRMSSVAPKLDGWKDKPLYSPKETTPEPVRHVSWFERQMQGDIILDPDYSLAWMFLILGFAIVGYHPSYYEDGSLSLIGVCGGMFHMLFASLLWVQTRRVRCVFEKDGFEFYNIKGPSLDFAKGAYLDKKPDNYVAGTRNRWKYDTIINYGFFPSLQFPVICYFKETETPEEKWDKWFAAFDSYGRGQPHFFPGICNARQFRAEMEARGVNRKPIQTFKKKNQD